MADVQKVKLGSGMAENARKTLLAKQQYDREVLEAAMAGEDIAPFAEWVVTQGSKRDVPSEEDTETSEGDKDKDDKNI